MINIQTALEAHLKDAATAGQITGVTANDISFENADFDPKSKTIFLNCHFFINESITQSKEVSSEYSTGFLQVDVMVPKNDTTDNKEQRGVRASSALTELRNVFAINSEIVDMGETISINSHSYSQPNSNGGWFTKSISINWSTI